MVVDQFLTTFTGYLSSGYQALQSTVSWVSATLIIIDLVIAALFWAWGNEGPDGVLRNLIRKILYVGGFIYIINKYQVIVNAIFDSFAKIGLLASGSIISTSQLSEPGNIAQLGFTAGDAVWLFIGKLTTSWVDTICNLPTILIFMVCYLIVLLCFFIIAIQLFVTLIEFRVSALCGFVLIPFAFWNKSSFISEKVIAMVISSGIKIMVIAIAVGIGQNVFNTFISSFASGTPTISNAMVLVLASLTFLLICQSLPSIAAGIVSGGPQLSAGSAIGAVGTAVGAGMAAGAAAKAGAGAVGSATKMTGSVAKGAASMAGAANTAGSLAVGTSGATSKVGKAAAYVGGVGAAAAGAAKNAALAPGRAAGAALSKAFKQGGAAGFKATGGTIKNKK